MSRMVALLMAMVPLAACASPASALPAAPAVASQKGIRSKIQVGVDRKGLEKAYEKKK